MQTWNTQQIQKDLQKILTNYKSIEVSGPECDNDTDNINVNFVSKESLEIFGYNSEDIDDPSEAEVYVVIINDHQDSRGGLNSTTPEVVSAYNTIKQYFSENGFAVGNTYKDYM